MKPPQGSSQGAELGFAMLTRTMAASALVRLISNLAYRQCSLLFVLVNATSFAGRVQGILRKQWHPRNLTDRLNSRW